MEVLVGAGYIRSSSTVPHHQEVEKGRSGSLPEKVEVKKDIVSVLRDPVTGSKLILNVTEECDGEVIDGTLGDHPIIRGIPYLYDSTGMNRAQKQTVDSFSSKWRLAPDYRENTSEFYWQWYLDRYVHGNERELERRLDSVATILDAGTGLGRDAEHFQQLSTADVFAVDLSDGIHLAYDRLHHTGIHFIRCDIARLPFAPGFFDFISCDQVLHHTPDPPQTLAHLAKHLSPGGLLHFYVYRRKAPMREQCDDYLRGITSQYPAEQCYKFSEQLTKLGQQLTEMNQCITVGDDIPELGIAAGTYDLQRFFYWHFIKLFYNPDFSWEDNVAVNFDWYHPIYARRYDRYEVIDMVERANLHIEHFYENESGFSVRVMR